MVHQASIPLAPLRCAKGEIPRYARNDMWALRNESGNHSSSFQITAIIVLRRDSGSVAVVDPDSVSDGHGVLGAEDVEAVEGGVPGVGADEVFA